MTTRFVTYSRRVSAPREIAELTNYLVLKQENSAYRPKRGDTIINWGCSELPAFLNHPGLRIINKPQAVANTVNKRTAFDLMAAAGVPIVERTRDIAQAREWLRRGKVVIQRNSLHGMQGEGIVVLEGERMPTEQGRLWTKYFDRKDEYRVHVMGGRSIDIQQKRLSQEKADEIRRQREAGQSVGNVFRIRSYPNGWVFTRGGVVCPAPVLEASIAAVRALGLDFGAVDIGYRRSDNTARVFEVNTAPGIEGSSIESYANGIIQLVTSAA